MAKSLAEKDGWFAHKNGGSREYNPYHAYWQEASHKAWKEGFDARFYATSNEFMTPELENEYEGENHD